MTPAPDSSRAPQPTSRSGVRVIGVRRPLAFAKGDRVGNWTLLWYDRAGVWRARCDCLCCHWIRPQPGDYAPRCKSCGSSKGSPISKRPKYLTRQG